MSLLSVNKLSVTLSNREVIKQASLSLGHGEFLGLVGPNGAGKSTFLKTLASLITPVGGTIEMDGSAVQKLPSEQRARRISYLAQDRTAHWPLKVERVVALGRFPHLAHWQNPGDDDQRIINEVIRDADIEHLRDRRYCNLSGGERMRVLLARALAVRADILLADEPITALDPAHAISVMQLLRNTCDSGNSVITVMHDLTLSARFCHKLVLMDKGTIIASGAPQDVLSEENLRKVYQVQAWSPGTDGYFVLPWNLCK